jgi:multicomponent Na+:H+ antiporter subunit G
VTGALAAFLSSVLAADAPYVSEPAPDGIAAMGPPPPAPETFAEGLAQLAIGDYIAILMLVCGTALCVLSSVGILRMPDLYTRMQAAAKAGTLGVACIILATAFHFGSVAVAVKVIMIMVFIFLTSPAAAHLIARAAYFVEVPIWKRTAYDDLHGCYTDDHRLINLPANAGPRSRSVVEATATEGEPQPAADDKPPRRATG